VQAAGCDSVGAIKCLVDGGEWNSAENAGAAQPMRKTAKLVYWQNLRQAMTLDFDETT
jgi:hypothetical protein